MNKITVYIALEIEGEDDGDDAFYVVDSLLAGGLLQDAVNDHACDAGPLHVLSAVSYGTEIFARKKPQ